jgi:cell division protein FtsQ
LVKKTTRKNRYIKKSLPDEDHEPRVRNWFRMVFRGGIGAAIITGMSLVCVFSHDWLTQCNYFKAADIAISGCSRFDPNTVKSTAGIEEGVNILSVNLASARKQLLAEPWIRDAGIRRVFPSRMTIDIVEHEALAVIDFGRPFLINMEGIIFKEFEPEKKDPESLPVIIGVDYEDWIAGSAGRKKMKANIFDSVMAVLELGKSEKSVVPVSAIEKIIVDKEIGLTLQVRMTSEFIELGFGDYEKKFERFAKIAAHLERAEMKQTYSLVDLKNPDRIVARPMSRNQVVAGKGGSSEGT